MALFLASLVSPHGSRHYSPISFRKGKGTPWCVGFAELALSFYNCSDPAGSGRSPYGACDRENALGKVCQEAPGEDTAGEQLEILFFIRMK